MHYATSSTLSCSVLPINIVQRGLVPLSDKRELAPALRNITRVPHHILMDGLSGDRLCIARIMSWTVDRRTTRVEDRAYSLMGLLDVNMPMLYGEEKRTFHRLQLEIIHT
ncbi:hypothetical protein SCLCIDRAFT_1210965 [Scleroderma citrinum Foug A]|uniref:Uncharacterized protein n=1 Tax=Scleroderma citrinum Foug A TaxID=1036808 RepID=A0A0C3EF21_9AGAM|nr:hypothetical protein SCLCIDRAFT_1210965 [Scleroderma citrinum Foug A]